MEEFKYLRVLFRSEGQMETLCIGDLWSQAVGSDRTNEIIDTSSQNQLDCQDCPSETMRRPRGELSTLRRETGQDTSRMASLAMFSGHVPPKGGPTGLGAPQECQRVLVSV